MRAKGRLVGTYTTSSCALTAALAKAAKETPTSPGHDREQSHSVPAEAWTISAHTGQGGCSAHSAAAALGIL